MSTSKSAWILDSSAVLPPSISSIEEMKVTEQAKMEAFDEVWHMDFIFPDYSKGMTEDTFLIFHVLEAESFRMVGRIMQNVIRALLQV